MPIADWAVKNGLKKVVSLVTDFGPGLDAEKTFTEKGKTCPIRFTARFFLCRVAPGQAPRLITEETSEGFWIHPGEAYRRFRANEMAMAEPAEYGVAYLAQFDSLEDVWRAHADGRHKFHGIVDRVHGFWKDFDWKQNRFPGQQ